MTFSDFISSTALSCVRSVVPKPGIVTPMIPLRSNPSTSNVRTATRRASVESNPPDMPITRFLVFVTCNLCARPLICIFIISSHRESMVSPLPGTKGSGLILRISPSWQDSVSLTGTCRTCLPFSSILRASPNDIICRRSRRIASMSISAIT